MKRLMLDVIKEQAGRAVTALARRFETESPSPPLPRVDLDGYVDSSDYVDPRPPEEVAYVEQFSPETEVERLRRRCDEYFSIIERIERERDGLWKMYRQSVSEHLNAQALMERHLMNTRRQFGRAVAMLNKMRKESELEPLKKPADLEPYEGEPIGTARKYADSMVELCSNFPSLLSKAKPHLVNGDEERKKVAGDDDAVD
jgi:hypothetical protein